ncbi:MAG TPA: hypothetical protein VFH03_26745 [Actinoplanes sp.]|nr:hypothetical protein [Actinoplanes sp.]
MSGVADGQHQGGSGGERDRRESAVRRDAYVLGAECPDSAVLQGEAEVDAGDHAEENGEEAERVVGRQQDRDDQRGDAQEGTDGQHCQPATARADGPCGRQLEPPLGSGGRFGSHDGHRRIA